MNSSREQSEFNMAISYLNRLNSLFYEADEAAISLDAHRWFHVLMAIFRELVTELKPDEKTNLLKKSESINEEIVKNSRMMTKKGINAISPPLYKELNDFEIKLREVLNEAGLLKKTMDDASAALR